MGISLLDQIVDQSGRTRTYVQNAGRFVQVALVNQIQRRCRIVLIKYQSFGLRCVIHLIPMLLPAFHILLHQFRFKGKLLLDEKQQADRHNSHAQDQSVNGMVVVPVFPGGRQQFIY